MLLDDYETTAEAAPRLGVERRMVQRYCQQGRIEYIKVGNQYFVKKDAVADGIRRPRSKGKKG